MINKWQSLNYAKSSIHKVNSSYLKENILQKLNIKKSTAIKFHF